MQDAFMRRHAIRIALVVISFAAAAAIAIGDVVHRAAAVGGQVRGTQGA